MRGASSTLLGGRQVPDLPLLCRVWACALLLGAHHTQLLLQQLQLLPEEAMTC